MAKGFKTGGRDFGPDNPPPKSPGPHNFSKEVREIRKLSADEVVLIVSTLLYADEDELESIEKDPYSSYFQKIVCSVLKKTRETGNMAQLDLLLNRVVGKVRERVEHEIIKPSILKRIDGSEVIFTVTASRKED